MQKDMVWLLEGSAWVEYNARLNLLHQTEESAEVKSTRLKMIGDPQIGQIIRELQMWPWKVLTNHKSAGHPIHLLTFLADIGIKSDDPGVETVISPLLDRQSPEGPFQSLVNIPTHFGGSGKDQYSWQLCDAPLLSYAFIKMGLQNDPRVQSSIQPLLSLVRENGWPCAGSKEIGKFHGPGKKDDPCPFATLIMLKTLALIPEQQTSPACLAGIECLLDLWENSLEKSPYLFRTGTDFRKLKAPLVWYDIVHVLDVLSQFETARRDRRVQEMLAVVKSKANDQGRYTPESIWTVWKGWDFGQKKEPSRWLTYLIYRIIQRVEDEKA
jgi:hypothetical protein